MPSDTSIEATEKLDILIVISVVMELICSLNMMLLAYKSKNCYNVYTNLSARIVRQQEAGDLDLGGHKRLKEYIDRYSS
jgi:hypothetical protein